MSPGPYGAGPKAVLAEEQAAPGNSGETDTDRHRERPKEKRQTAHTCAHVHGKRVE